MINLDIHWSDPYQWENKDGDLVWRRVWKIPVEYRSAFFTFWNGAKYRMWGEGFSVAKIDNDWFLYETKVCIENFSEIGAEKPTPPPEAEEFWLPPYKVKDESGLRPWQVDSVSKLVTAINKGGCAIDGSDVGVGKCHSKGTKIRMYDGNLKNVEHICVGDKIMGDDSTPRTVLSLARGLDEMYEIVPTNGGIPWGCNKEHILILDYKARKQTTEISVKDFLLKYKTNRHNWTLKRAVVNYKHKGLKIDPYLMGLWIGDGTWNSSSITTNKNDKPIIDYLYSCENKIISNCNIRIYKSKNRVGSNCNTYYLRGTEKGKNELWQKFKNYGFGINREKFIPTDYLINTEYYRKSLLAGLIDSDGWKDKNGCYGIITKWKRLQLDIVELARSLGYKVSINDRISKNNNFGINGNVYYKIQISGAHDLPVLLDRKKSTIRKQKKSVLSSGFKIIPKGIGEYFGFTLDGNHRYLLEDFTITHNTYVACAVARELGMKILVVCPLAVTYPWREVIVDHFKMKKSLVGIINYEQIRIGKTDSPFASFVENRKTHKRKFVWKIPKDTLIIWDESQKLKNWKTKNSKTCIEALKQNYKMLFCSATNATNPLELRTVGTCLKLFKGATAYYQWCYEHGVFKGRFGLEFTEDMKLRQKVLKKLHRDIFINRGVRLTRDTIPDFPDSEVIAECYNMGDEDVKKINDCHEEMKKELKELARLVKKDKASELTAILRARQQIELVKVPLFIDMIEEGLENGMSVVVFVNFTETLQSIAKRMNTSCIFDGKTDNNVRQQNVDDFQSGKEKVILVNIASGGAGLSLHDIHGLNPRLTLISPSYSAVLMRQATGRVWRENSKSKSVQKIVFVANTVEEKVCDNVKEKLKNLDMLNDGDLKYEEVYEVVNA
jgi:hypothetical protein